MNLPLLLLAGGLATRLGAITEKIPKSMVFVAGKPFIDYQLTLLRRNGITDVVICAGHLGDVLQEHIGDGSSYNLKVRYSFDGPSPLGTGGAILKASKQVDGPFFVMYGDSYLPIDFGRVEKAFDRNRFVGLMTVFHNFGKWDASNVVYRDGIVVQYSKRDENPKMDYIDYGLGILTPGAFANCPREKAFDLAGVYEELAGQKKLMGFEVAQRFYEIGTPQGLKDTEKYLEEGRGKNGRSI